MVGTARCAFARAPFARPAQFANTSLRGALATKQSGLSL
jgi:hypothetical protein